MSDLLVFSLETFYDLVDTVREMYVGSDGHAQSGGRWFAYNVVVRHLSVYHDNPGLEDIEWLFNVDGADRAIYPEVMDLITNNDDIYFSDRVPDVDEDIGVVGRYLPALPPNVVYLHLKSVDPDEIFEDIDGIVHLHVEASGSKVVVESNSLTHFSFKSSPRNTTTVDVSGVGHMLEYLKVYGNYERSRQIIPGLYTLTNILYLQIDHNVSENRDEDGWSLSRIPGYLSLEHLGNINTVDHLADMHSLSSLSAPNLRSLPDSVADRLVYIDATCRGCDMIVPEFPNVRVYHSHILEGRVLPRCRILSTIGNDFEDVEVDEWPDLRIIMTTEASEGDIEYFNDLGGNIVYGAGQVEYPDEFLDIPGLYYTTYDD